MGYEVFNAYDGEQGYEQFHNYRPDLVITDIIMPGRDGMELIVNMGMMNSSGDLAFPCKITTAALAKSGPPRLYGI